MSIVRWRYPFFVVACLELYHSTSFYESNSTLSLERRGEIYTHSLPIMQVDCLPIRVIPRVESSPIGVELVREDKIPLLVGVRERRLSVRTLRCRNVNKTNVVRDLGNLASSICAAQVERALCCLEFSGEMTVDRVAGTEISE